MKKRRRSLGGGGGAWARAHDENRKRKLLHVRCSFFSLPLLLLLLSCCPCYVMSKLDGVPGRPRSQIVHRRLPRTERIVGRCGRSVLQGRRWRRGRWRCRRRWVSVGCALCVRSLAASPTLEHFARDPQHRQRSARPWPVHRRAGYLMPQRPRRFRQHVHSRRLYSDHCLRFGTFIAAFALGQGSGRLPNSFSWGFLYEVCWMPRPSNVFSQCHPLSNKQKRVSRNRDCHDIVAGSCCNGQRLHERNPPSPGDREKPGN